MSNGMNKHARLLCSAASAALVLYGGAAYAADAKPITIAPQSLASALHEFGVQSGHQVLFKASATAEKVSPGVTAEGEIDVALSQLLAGTGMSFRRAGDVFLIEQEGEGGPQSESAAGGGAEVEALIVTAQKREEDIQDVPIAISAFTQEQLERSQVAGGPDLMTQVPNMTFTKTNFSGYSIQLRGIGTQAISATTDPAVAVAFNNTPFIRNRFFEQEFYDLQRVEVLRGPQGTLFGRNATAGVVNLISQKPKLDVYEAKLSGEVANYNSTRIEGMLNIPLASDIVALRAAGAWTKREGYAVNEVDSEPIDGRDLWSTRLSLRIAPTDALDVNLIWEHFREDDDRLRSGKQVCKTHKPETIAGLVVPWGQAGPGSNNDSLYDQTFSQGCEAASLYSPDSFQVPNGLRLPYYRALAGVGLPIFQTGPDGKAFDPYASTVQSTDLRVIESTVDPVYQAETNLVELQATFDVTDTLTLTSETAYLTDTVFASQDYNRFNTRPGAFNVGSATQPTKARRLGILDENGFFCDPQIGCANRLVAMDLSTATSRQFAQEFRVGSNFEGPFNFSLGANFLRYDTVEKYYVFINTLTMYAAERAYFGDSESIMTPWNPGVSDNRECMLYGYRPPNPDEVQQVTNCVFIDPNPIHSLNDLGHNYFLSNNPYKLISYAVFGEAYYNFTDTLKLTAGLRWTVDKKEAPRIPSWVLGAETVGYPVAEVIEQEWREPTGRLTLDWKPDLGFTDETMLYASYGHGYKAGGANPPAAGLVMYHAELKPDWGLYAEQQAAVAPRTFDAEFIDAFELGAKNTMFDGRVTLNLAAFYYDYRGYQISQIVNRSAINRNFDAEVWGLEIEADWRPLENLKLGFKGGYEQTRVADGSKAVDVMDRTAGNPDWFVTAPFPTLPSNCILPTYVVTRPNGVLGMLGVPGGGGLSACEVAYVLGQDPVTWEDYVPNPADPNGLPGGFYWYPGYQGFDPYTAPNGGAGFDKDLSGNELPNAPNFTATITADYTIPLPNDWLATLHTDLYYQSEAWTRIFNMEGYDKLKAYTNVNLAAIFTNEDAGWKVMAFVKNVFDRDSITGAFLNSDDTGLTTNVFLTEPRLYGLRVTKEWNGGPWWTGANLDHKGPFPLTVEMSGQVQRHDADYATIHPNVFGNFTDELDPTAAQHHDLDLGDGRELRLTYRPVNSPWSISGGMRYGRTNTSGSRARAEVEGDEVCGWATSGPYGHFGKALCDPTYSLYGLPPGTFYGAHHLRAPIEWVSSDSKTLEEHAIIDFEVGHDVGIGGLASQLAVGLRRASFSSKTWFDGSGVPMDIVPEGWEQGELMEHVRFEARGEVRREFEGVGPTVKWSAAAPLLGGDETGRLNVDWSLTGGLLFGNQENEVIGESSRQRIWEDFWNLVKAADPREMIDLAQETPARNKSVTVPLVDLSLGLSYEAGRVKVGAGYRWERYFDVLDTGYDEEVQSDRTIDGPYFKIAVGFGG